MTARILRVVSMEYPINSHQSSSLTLATQDVKMSTTDSFKIEHSAHMLTLP